jgi:hypothetical protein
VSEDAGVFLLSRWLRQRCGVKIWHFVDIPRAAVGNFAITSSYFLRRDTSESLTGVHSASKVGNSPITFAPSAGICLTKCRKIVIILPNDERKNIAKQKFDGKSFN